MNPKQQFEKALEEGNASEIIRWTQMLQAGKALARAQRISELKQEIAEMAEEHQQLVAEAKGKRTLSLAAADAVLEAKKAAGLAAKEAGLAENRATSAWRPSWSSSSRRSGRKFLERISLISAI